MDRYAFSCSSCNLKLALKAPVVSFSQAKCPRCGSKAVAEKLGQSTYSPPKPGSRQTQFYRPGIEGTKYIYLAKHCFADTWIKGGGPVPIALASSYLSDKRDGVMTPDENLIHDSPVDLAALRPMIHLQDVQDFSMTGCTFNGIPIPDIRNANYYQEDGLVLCLSNTLSRDICERLNKVTCVAVDDVQALKTELDGQLEAKSRAESCRYTAGHRRDHFLKHASDSWMDEFRLFWPITESRTVYLPAGLARAVEMPTEQGEGRALRSAEPTATTASRG